MPQGAIFVFNEFPNRNSRKVYDFGADAVSARLVTSLPAKTLATPNIADLTECTAGGSYTAGGILLAGVTVTTTGNLTEIKSTTNPSWSPAAGSPTNIKALVVVHNATGDLLLCVDLTPDDGATAVSMVAGPISCTWSGGVVIRQAT